MKVLVVSVRGWHLGYLGCYGNGWIATPVLDQLAAGGVVFDQHLADVPDAETARRTWRDGRHHFPTLDAAEEPPSTFDLIAALRSAGVTTALVADGTWSMPEEFARGWDECEIVRGEGTQLEQTLEVARGALEQLAQLDNWLLWVDLASLLPPWNVPADFSDPYFREPAEEEEEFEEDPGYEDDAEEEPEEEEEPLLPWTDPPVGPIHTEDDLDFCLLQSTCAGAASYLDAGIGVLLEEVGEDCLVIVTSDHGQALGEHGICGPYRPWLHDELLHIPLILRVPGASAQGLRVSALTQTTDIAPTLLAAFGLPIPPELHGHNLLPLTREGEATAERRKVACAGLRIGPALEWCLRTPEWAYLLPARSHSEDEPRQPQLYVKPDDRWEANDVIQHHAEKAETFERLLRAYIAASRQTGPLQVPPFP